MVAVSFSGSFVVCVSRQSLLQKAGRHSEESRCCSGMKDEQNVEVGGVVWPDGQGWISASELDAGISAGGV